MPFSVMLNGIHALRSSVWIIKMPFGLSSRAAAYRRRIHGRNQRRAFDTALRAYSVRTEGDRDDATPIPFGLSSRAAAYRRRIHGRNRRRAFDTALRAYSVRTVDGTSEIQHQHR